MARIRLLGRHLSLAIAISVFFGSHSCHSSLQTLLNTRKGGPPTCATKPPQHTICSQIDPVAIEYFKTGEIFFKLFDNCAEHNFTLFQLGKSEEEVDWTNRIKWLSSGNTAYNFSIEYANFSSSGLYYASCDNCTYEPTALEVFVPVKPLIADVHVDDSYNKSQILSCHIVTENYRRYSILIHLFPDTNTILYFDLGLGRYIDENGNQQTATFQVQGISSNTTSGQVVQYLEYPDYPLGERVVFYMSADYIAAELPQQCTSDFLAKLYMPVNLGDTLKQAMLEVEFMYKPQALSFQITEECVLTCSAISSCPVPDSFTMKFTRGESVVLWASSTGRDYVTLKLPIEMCKWFASRKDYHNVSCVASNKVGSSELEMPLVDVPGFERFVESNDGLATSEILLITFSILLAISIGINLFIFRKKLVAKNRCHRPTRPPSISIAHKVTPDSNAPLPVGIPDSAFEDDNYIDPLSVDGTSYDEVYTEAKTAKLQAFDDLEMSNSEYMDPHYIDPVSHQYQPPVQEQRSRDF